MSERKGFTDGEPHIATAEDLTRPWGGVRDGSRFRCYLCGHRFAVGDTYRWQFTNGIPGASGNLFVCAACDGPDVVERWKAMHEEWKRDSGGKWWWFTGEEVTRARRSARRTVSEENMSLTSNHPTLTRARTNRSASAIPTRPMIRRQIVTITVSMPKSESAACEVRVDRGNGV